MKKPQILLEDSQDMAHELRLAEFIDCRKKVEVYKNLNTDAGLWSVRQGGIVKLHTDYIILRNVKFAVQPAGRAKVLKEQRKNVHAFVRGYLTTRQVVDAMEHDCIISNPRYNPYKYTSFVDDDEQPILTADLCDMMTGSPLITWTRAPKTQQLLF
jgi:hypothetical protein|tara:strand:+ start:5709 stop:6176 length:468 start_codon:yes stop_codon:yes gene_type:complete